MGFLNFQFKDGVLFIKRLAVLVIRGTIFNKRLSTLLLILKNTVEINNILKKFSWPHVKKKPVINRKSLDVIKFELYFLRTNWTQRPCYAPS